jgi:hypothetical protein
LNAQPSEQNTELVRHVNEVTFARHRWQFATPDYYIPKANVPFRSTLIVGYYTFKPIFILNPIVIDSELERNQNLTQLEQLRNLEQRSSCQSNFQQHEKIGGNNSGPCCCTTNTTISSNCLVECTCHENN